MPVWGTLKDILKFCAREWRAALKFGAVPVAVNIALVVFFTEVSPQTMTEYTRSWTASLISILVYAPFCIAWYRMILFGHGAVATRSFFTLTGVEVRFFGGMLLVSILSALLGIILTLIGAAIVIVLSLASEVAALIASVTLAAGGLAVLLMALSRWSIGLAMIASGEKMDLQRAWSVAKPYGWPMAGVQIIIFAVIAGIAGAVLGSFFPDFVEAVRTQTAASERTQLIVQLTGTLSGAIALWLSTTMYALVYRMAVPGQGAQPAGSFHAVAN